MAIKLTLHEMCPRCGLFQARLDGNGGVIFNHDCPKAPPGPYVPPRRYRLSEVNFIPAGKEVP